MSSHGVVQPGDRRTDLSARIRKLFMQHIKQADEGCDFDFLEGTASIPEPRFTDACKRKAHRGNHSMNNSTLWNASPDVGMYALAREQRHRSIELQLAVSRRSH